MTVFLGQFSIQINISTTQVQNSDNFSLNEPTTEENEVTEVELADKAGNNNIGQLPITFNIGLRYHISRFGL